MTLIVALTAGLVWQGVLVVVLVAREFRSLRVLAGLLFAYPTRRFQSAWMGIVVHSAQSVVFAVIALGIVI